MVRKRGLSRAVVPKTDGNVDGKGLNGLLQDWLATKPRDIEVKSQHTIVAEFFTSMLVLSAKFRFRPVVGAAYYLYWFDGNWSLSLIAPDEWSEERRAGFTGMCVLQRDMTWTIAPSDRLAEETPASIAISRFYDAFVRKFDSDRTLEDILPTYVSGLPYFQRLHASALSRSLRTAIHRSDHGEASCRQWLLALPQRQDLLPGGSG